MEIIDEYSQKLVEDIVEFSQRRGQIIGILKSIKESKSQYLIDIKATEDAALLAFADLQAVKESEKDEAVKAIETSEIAIAELTSEIAIATKSLQDAEKKLADLQK